MTHKIETDTLWANGEDAHVNDMIAKARKKITALLAKIKQTENPKQHQKINDEIEKIKLEVETKLNKTKQNLY